MGHGLAKVLTDAGSDVTLWARRPELANGINATHENADYLKGLLPPERLTATHEAAEALGGADIVALAIPRRRCGRICRTGRCCSCRMQRWSA